MLKNAKKDTKFGVIACFWTSFKGIPEHLFQLEWKYIPQKVWDKEGKSKQRNWYVCMYTEQVTFLIFSPALLKYNWHIHFPNFNVLICEVQKGQNKNIQVF